ncbi:LacI family DNA-binding transcriptional regulator [Indiicoccus explosivorum]|uniref:LacI family DNA-binding transcriptional regulator n=1 Tax=Indiicoccus explosivorum TaxID=1917864 RepID=UPI000B43E51D|nr:LacI family DNA-binding transcriptional regulator [Indiicoccus explosivorum]
MRPTIYDIARVANVSKSTVSRFLNNQKNVSLHAQERILNAIEELNYHPSKLAQSLSKGFDAILIVSRSNKTTADNPFFSEILHSITQRAEEENFDVILQTSHDSEEELRKCTMKIREKMIKGIIMLTSPASEEMFQQLDVFNIPVVVIGKVEGTYNNVFCVDTDNYRDSYDLTRYLISQGHEKIACMHSPFDYNVAIDRFSGYADCMADHELRPHEDWIVNSGYASDEAYMAARQLLAASEPPTAVFATDDIKVVGAYKAFSEKGLRIPEDISIVGYTNQHLSQFLFPALTGIEIPVRKLGETGTELLFSKIKKNDASSQSKVILPTGQLIRDSVSALTAT